MIPEKGDQVVIAFEEGNIARPVVLGSVYHGKSGDSKGFKNSNKKGLTSRKGSALQFDDELHTLNLGAQIVDEGLLIADLNTKLFFDQYLIGHANINGAYTRVFFSQLFEGEPATLDIEQLIMNETPDRVTISKVGKMDRSKLDLKVIMQKILFHYILIILYRFRYLFQTTCLMTRQASFGIKILLIEVH